MGYLRKIERKKRKTNQRTLGTKFALGVVILWTIFITTCVGGAYLGYLLLDLPDISGIQSYRPKQVTEVLDRNGVPIDYWYQEKRWVVPLSVMPEYLKNAFLAAEDARFYEHPGIDIFGILRALIKDIEAGSIIQGASTITQQVTRALLLTPKKSWIRKIKEAILAWKIDHMLSKDDILAIYLNQIYLGERSYGVEAASRTYFNKHVWDIDLPEAAMLAGLTQAPSKYDPLKHFRLAKKRQFYVLRRMAEEGFITETQAKRAYKEKITFDRYTIIQPRGVKYFLQDLKKDLLRRYGKRALFTQGLIITTTLDSSLQNHAFNAVETGIKELCARHPDDPDLRANIHGALIAMKNSTGEILAMVGGLNFSKSKFNLATQGVVQPGSAFKPIVYSAAIERGLVLPNTILVDGPISLPGQNPEIPWSPENFDKRYMGPITVRTALEYSRNVVAVKVARMVGVDQVIDLAHKMGITTPIPRDLSIALGSLGVRLSELVQSFSAFPNLGWTVRPQLVLNIEDRDGNTLEELTPLKRKVISSTTAYEMLDILKGVVRNGTGRRAKALGIPVGGKTGTTDDYRDALFLGFTKDVVCGVWLGRKDRGSLGRLETGGRAACPIWTDFMKWTIVNATDNDKDPDRMAFSVPDGIVIVPVDRRTGKIVMPEKGNKKDKTIWMALPQQAVPELEPHRGHFPIPGWLKRIFLSQTLRASYPFFRY